MNTEETMDTTKDVTELLRAAFRYGHEDFIPMTIAEMDLHSRKNHDYAHGGDPLGNFHRVSDQLKIMGVNIPPHMVAIIYAQKQIDAATQMMTQGYEGSVEGVDERLADVHVYYKLARILYRRYMAERAVGMQLQGKVIATCFNCDFYCTEDFCTPGRPTSPQSHHCENWRQKDD